MKALRSLLTWGLGSSLIPWSLLALDPARSIYQYNCQSWTRQYGLPVNGINAIAQTSDGQIWLGTHGGLVSFDGREFKLVGMAGDRDVRGTIVQSLAPDGQGGLWFGLRDSAYGHYDGRGRWIIGRDKGGSTYWNVHAVLQTREGKVWALGDNLSGWRNDKGAIEGVPFSQSSPPLPAVMAVTEDVQGRLWLPTARHGLFRWQDGTLSKFPDPGLENMQLTAVAVDHQGRIWLGTTTGLICYDAQFKRQDVAFPSNQVNALLVDSHGSLWVGMEDSGVARLRDGQLNILRKSDGLAGDSVFCLTEDREGSLWIGGREGLSQLLDIKFPTYSDRDGFWGQPVNSVSASPRGGVWSANKDGITYFDGWGTLMNTNAGLREFYAKRVFEARNGDVFVVSGRNEVEVLSGGKLVARHPTRDMAVALTEDSVSVVVSVADELYRVSRGSLTTFPFEDGKKPPLYWVGNLMTAKDGAIWVACVNGVCRVKDGKYQQWTTQEGLGDFAVRWICEDSDGVIWAGMPSGIARLKDNQIRNIRREDGLFDAAISAIIPDKFGFLWVDSQRGIYRLSRQSLNDFADGRANKVECKAYDGLDAVKPSDRNAQEQSGCTTPDGMIWFPSDRGVVMIDPANIISNRVAPPVRVTGLWSGRKALPLSANVVLSPDCDDLEFQYAAYTYRSSRKAQFRYRLEGRDEDWVEAENRTTASYTDLKPGSYIFHVVACNSDGVWNMTGDRIELELLPHYYQTASFKVIVGLSVVLGLFGTYRWSVNRIQRTRLKLEQDNERLEARVRKRTDQLAEQRNLLKTLIDNLPDNVFVKDTQGRVILNNLAHARTLGLQSPDEAVGKSDFDAFPRALAEKFFATEQELLQTGKTYNAEEVSINLATGKPRWTRTSKVPLRDAQGKIVGLAGINRDITERKEWEAKLEALHRQLMEASRAAGMAEVATSVLHNVGNVLNSVNVSAALVAQRLKASKAGNLAKVATLLREHQSELATFLTQDAKGRQLVSYLETLAEHLAAEKSLLLDELDGLTGNVEHIKEIVSRQQSYARAAGVAEQVPPSQLMEDALRMQSASFDRHEVEIVREFADTPEITVDRHKVLQILVNLFQNARHACEGRRNERRIVARIQPAPGQRIHFVVEDNGVGIPPENLTRIFTQGFTTRKYGHGFGLHSGAIAAKEMGGSLTATSRGAGEGATFVLELPLELEQGQGTRNREDGEGLPGGDEAGTAQQNAPA